MSMPAPDPEVTSVEPTVSGDVDPLPSRDGWSLIVLVPYDGKEPPHDVSDQLARAVWCAVSAPWHPSLLARSVGLPRIEPVESPSTPGPREVRIIVEGTTDRLPSGYRTQAEDAGAALLESGSDRDELIARIEARIGKEGASDPARNEPLAATARDFLAIGTVRWMLRDLTIAMGHSESLDRESLWRELMAGAQAWQLGDGPAAVNRLRAAFEVLTQARERFYPVDAYVLDLCLLDPAMAAGMLAGPLETAVAITFVAPAQAIENQAAVDPDAVAALRQAIADGWADVAGGTYAEAEDALLPLESILWQFRRGADIYRAHLDDRNVETYARRRFGLFVQLPQIAKRFGIRYGVHVSFDAGRFPVRPETKRLWESPDGSSLECLLRPPLAADRDSPGWLLPWRMGATMRDDHVAAVPLVHWPNPVAPWYRDLRRVSTYSPVLGRWNTLNDFFHMTDRPYETFRPEPDSYATPYLAQAVATREGEPVSKLARHHRLRARLEGLRTIQSLARALASAADSSTSISDGPSLEAIEERIETGRHGEASPELDRALPDWAGELTRLIVGAGAASGGKRPGYLVINPLGVPRRAAVILPEAALDLRPEGPLRSAQFTDEGVYAVVDLPAFGFAWVPAEADPGRPPATSGGLLARGRELRNESVAIEVDATTGGLRSIAAVGEETPRLAQQLVLAGLVDTSGKPINSQMRCDRFEIDYGGPALLQGTSSGSLIDPRQGNRVASFVQRYRLWVGRPILEIDVNLKDLDPAWLEHMSRSDPWSVYLSCRWAWPDANSMLRRTVLLSPELTEADRPETPDAFDISTRTQRTALLFGGLPYHRKHGSKMLDTLLIAGSETCRSFSMGVVLDLEYPFHAAQEMIAPAVVVPTDQGPPALGITGWLAHLDHKNVVISRVEFTENAGDRGWGLVFHVLETAGQSGRCRLRLFRDPTWARQVDFLGETIIDLSVEGDGVQVDLTPNELARVEVTLG
ncbi:MAG: glycosyl hydrolase family 38 [Isosphaeraceae bacterium]